MSITKLVPCLLIAKCLVLLANLSLSLSVGCQVVKFAGMRHTADWSLSRSILVCSMLVSSMEIIELVAEHSLVLQCLGLIDCSFRLVAPKTAQEVLLRVGACSCRALRANLARQHC